MLRRKRGDKPLAELWRKHKSDELKLEEQNLQRSTRRRRP